MVKKTKVRFLQKIDKPSYCEHYLKFEEIIITSSKDINILTCIDDAF